MFDLIIRNAKLVDGTGAPAREADIAIKDGLIAEIGTVGSIEGTAATEIDARWRSCNARLGRYSHPL